MAIGDTIRPELGRTDFTPFMQGSMAGSAALGQGIANLGASAGDALKQIGEAKREVAGTAQFLKSAKKMMSDPNQVAAVDQMLVRLETAPLREAAGVAQKAKEFVQFMGDQADRRLNAQALDINRAQFFADLNAAADTRAYQREMLGMQASQAKQRAREFKVEAGLEERRVKSQERKLDIDEAAAAWAAANPPMSKEEEKIFDKEFPQVLDWTTKGQPAAQMQLDKLNPVIAGLAKAAVNELPEGEAQRIVAEAGFEWDQVDAIDTGPINSVIAGTGNIGRIGSLGFWDDTIQGLKNAQDLVDSVTFQSLSDTFPGAISEGERKALSQTEFDKTIDSTKNLSRLLERRDFITKKAKSLNELAAKYDRGPLAKDRAGGGERTQRQQEDDWARERLQREQESKKSSAPNLQGALPKPLQPYAGTFEAAGEKYGVNPRFLAAISMLETARGTSSAFRNKKNAMGVSNSQGPISFEKVEDSIDRMARVLANPKGPYAGRKTVAEIASVYAPPGAGNDPNSTNSYWPTGVSKFMQALGLDPKMKVIN